MSESEYNCGTAILTSKTPQQASLIIPNSLTSTTNLIEKCLLNWFNNYGAYLQRQNKELQELLGQGSGFFKANQYHEEFGNFYKTWNCLLNSIQSEIHSNELLYKNIKLEIIGPLKDIIEKDIRYSELLINSQEIQEIASDMSNNSNNAEIQWNMKAPQIFNNFENFKKFEKQLLFDIVLNYFNSNNQKLNKELTGNENSVKYLLGEFKIDDEMENYLKFLLKCEFRPLDNIDYANSQLHTHAKKRLSAVPKHDNNSIVSSSSKSKSAKKHSKLKSKVGSIFGRKSKRSSKLNGLSNDTIHETDSISSSVQHRSTDNLSKSHTRNSSLISRDNSVQSPSTDVHGRFSQQRQSYQQPQQSVVAPLQSAQVSEPSQVSKLENRGPSSPLVSTYQQGEQIPSEASHPTTTQSQPPQYTSVVTPLTTQSPQQQSYGSPNIIKYGSDTSSDEDGPKNSKGERLSMLERHDLVPEQISEPRQSIQESRQSSSGKYSFETGDDQIPISATPRIYQEKQQNTVKDNHFPEPNDANNVSLNQKGTLGAPALAVGGGISGITANTSSVSAMSNGESIESSNEGFESQPSKTNAAPPPPPSRKVVHHQSSTKSDDQSADSQMVSAVSQSRNRKEIHSQIFHNLPNARDSIIQPQSSLISQDTGNSLLKHNEFFKHFDSATFVELKGLNSSVAEVINVNFKDSKLVKSQIIGEIAFSYKSVDESLNDIKPILIKLPNNFDKIILNTSFIERLGNDENYKLNPIPIISKTLGGLKYLKKLNDSQVPILIQQIWKFEDHQSSLMIILKLNPSYSSNLKLNNVVISVALNQSIETTSASSRPQGSFNKEMNRITWRYSQPLILSSENPEEKLIARFLTNSKGSEHESGIQVKFLINDPPSKFSKALYFDDESTEVPCVRNLISGSYSSHS